MDGVKPQHYSKSDLSLGRPLFIAHTPSAEGGELARVLKQVAGKVDLVFSFEGLPDIHAIKGPVIILGGPMGVADLPHLPWLQRELEWIQILLEKQHKMIGICLGAQLIAHALGHQVKPCPQGSMECGYYPLYPSQGSEKFSLPPHAYQWHQDAIIPAAEGKEIDVLARYDWHDGQALQAYRYCNAIGLQFHPEVDHTTISRWINRDPHHLQRPGTKPAHLHMEDHIKYGDITRKWIHEVLVKHWLIGEIQVEIA